MPEFDVIVYGATGFTGQIAVQALSEHPEFRGLRYALAGRNPDKLAALSGRTPGNPPWIVANSDDGDLIAKMVARSRVIVNFAGPFTLYAESLIKAAAEQGKIYLDITGETPFVRSMIETYQEVAQHSGARLIPLSGFDSVPADLMCFLLCEYAAKHGLQIDRLAGFYQARGGVNGGTLLSAAEMAEQGLMGHLSDGNMLITDPNCPKVAAASLLPQYARHFNSWVIPFVMGPINRAVVMRSFWLNGKPLLPYDEFHLVTKRYFGTPSLVAGAILGIAALGLKTSLGRSILRRFGPQSGSGPSAAVRAKSRFRLSVIGSYQGKEVLQSTIASDGDPGNEVTIRLILASAKLALAGHFATPQCGFLTPTVAFGHHLTAQLEKVGFQITTTQIGD